MTTEAILTSIGTITVGAGTVLLEFRLHRQINPGSIANCRMSRVVFICVFVLFPSLLVHSGDAFSQSTVEIVKEGYWQTVERMGEAEGDKLIRRLDAIPAKIPHDIVHDVKSLWKWLNMRLREEHIGVKVVLETNFPAAQSKEIWLDRKVTSWMNKELTPTQLDQALAKMSCFDLIAVIAQNGTLNILFRKGVLVLCNYVHP